MGSDVKLVWTRGWVAMGINPYLMGSKKFLFKMASALLIKLKHQVEKTYGSKLGNQQRRLFCLLNGSRNGRATSRSQKNSRVRLKDSLDSLVWIHLKSSSYSPKAGYANLVASVKVGDKEWWFKTLWEIECSANSILFLWNMLRQKVLTWDNLQKIFIIGPGW